jgi:transposase-like protein
MPTNAPPKAERAGETGDAGSFIPVNNRIETDHGRLKSRLRPMRGLKQLHCARVITAGHAFVQNLRRGHYELGVEEPTALRVVAAFTELTAAI